MKNMMNHILINLILVCPAGWHPGADTIIPNPAEKLKYFSKNYETKKNIPDDL